MSNICPFVLSAEIINLNGILKSFYCKKRNSPPRKEFLRCNIFRKFIKTINRIIKGKVKLNLEPLFLNLCSLVLQNKEELLKAIHRDCLPYTENKKNTQFKSFNNEFCELFFEGRLLVQQIFCVFIEYIFTLDIRKLSKDIGVFCCKNDCTSPDACGFRYQQLKLYIAQDILYKKF